MAAKIFPRNEHTIDRLARVVLGLGLLALVFTGPKTPWGFIARNAFARSTAWKDFRVMRSRASVAETCSPICQNTSMGNYRMFPEASRG